MKYSPRTNIATSSMHVATPVIIFKLFISLYAMSPSKPLDFVEGVKRVDKMQRVHLLREKCMRVIGY